MIALLYLFTGLASTFVDSGFSAALIQKKNITLIDESTVFWFNLFMAGAMVIGLWALAPWISEFYQIEELTTLTRVLAFTILINALSSIHNTLLIKGLKFKTIMKVGVVASVLSGLAAIYLARHGYGVWALAVQAVLSSAVSTILLWGFSKWRPRWVFSVDSVRTLFGFGGYLMAASILDVLYNRLYTVLIGKWYGATELGFYTRADNTKQIPVNLLSGVLTRVAFPIFSVAKDDKDKLYKGVKLAVQGLMIINVPIMLGLMVTADKLVPVLFGEQWFPAISLLQVLCLAGLFWPLHVINLNVLKAQGYTHLFFRLEVIKKLLGTIFLLVGIMSYGVIGLAWSQVLFGLVAFFINAFYTGRYLNYGPLKQIKDFFPILIISSVVAYIVLIAGNYLADPLWLVLVKQVVIGITLFMLICICFSINAYRACVNLLIR